LAITNVGKRSQRVVGLLLAAHFLVAVAGLPSRSVEAGDDQSTRTESIAIGGTVSNSTIDNTITTQDPAVLAAMAKTFADQIAATTEARGQAEGKAAELAAKLGFTSAAVQEFFKMLGEQNVPEDQMPARLIEVATRFAKTRDELAALGTDDPVAAQLATSAKQALDAGQLATAASLLDRAKEGELAAIRQAHELRQMAQEAEDRHALNAAKLLAGRLAPRWPRSRCRTPSSRIIVASPRPASA
jgi:hypothetical protein